MKRIKLVASDGKWLTNGELYGKLIYLAEGVSETDFYEITEEEYQAKMSELEAERLAQEK